MHVSEAPEAQQERRHTRSALVPLCAEVAAAAGGEALEQARRQAV